MMQTSCWRRMMALICLVTGLFWHILALRSYGQESKTKIRIAIPSASICCLHLFAAQQWKTFDENGLDVEIIQMRPQVANAAMVSGRFIILPAWAEFVAATLRGLSSRRFGLPRSSSFTRFWPDPSLTHSRIFVRSGSRSAPWEIPLKYP